MNETDTDSMELHKEWILLINQIVLYIVNEICILEKYNWFLLCCILFYCQPSEIMFETDKCA